jgi:hypothetical protein
VRETIFKVEGREGQKFFSSSEGSQAVPACPSGRGENEALGSKKVKF